VEAGLDILAALRARGITVRLDEDGRPHVGPRPLVGDADLALLQAHREEVVAALVATRFVLPACPACGASDYLPLGAGWRRCWTCHQAWGPPGVPEPVLESPVPGWLVAALGLASPLPSRRRRRQPSPLLRVLSVPVEVANRNERYHAGSSTANASVRPSDGSGRPEGHGGRAPSVSDPLAPPGASEGLTEVDSPVPEASA
jgi:hypothetical protein